MEEEPPGGNDQQARVFFALWPDADTSGALQYLAEQARERFGGRVMRRDTLHMTLAFIGSVPRRDIAELIDAGASVATAVFDLELDQLGSWKSGSIVWAGPTTTPEPLAMLAGSLHQRLSAAGFRLEQRPFAPHVTLLRNATNPTRRFDLENPVRWRVGEFQLVESKSRQNGARYGTLAKWPVGGRL